MHESILVYAGEDGSEWRGTYDAKDRIQIKKDFKEKGYVGYLSGYHLHGEFRYSVLAFFKYHQPSHAEILRRRQNGFKSAKWNWL